MISLHSLIILMVEVDDILLLGVIFQMRIATKKK